MKKIASKFLGLATVLLLALPVFADNADLALSAFKAKKDKDVAALVQTMAMNADFAGLDKVRESAPDVFDVKYFPSDFVSGVIFKYVETKASQQKPAAAPAKAVTANPNKVGTWQYAYWDLQKAYAAWQKSTDPAAQAKLKTQVDGLVNQIQVLMENMPPEQQLQAGMALALIAYADGGAPSGAQSTMEILNAKFSEQALDILKYLFRVGIPFPSSLPNALSLSDWQREVAAFNFYWDITDPSKKGEFETDSEFSARKVEVDRLQSVIFATEISLPFKLTLGAYNIEEGFFPIAVSLALPLNADNTPTPKTDAQVAAADVRYFVARKNAQLFKDKTFATWSAAGTLRPASTGGFALKELSVKTADGPVTDNLWGVEVTTSGDFGSDTEVTIRTYFPGREVILLLGDSTDPVRKVTSIEASIALPGDGMYQVIAPGETTRVLWKKNLTQKVPFVATSLVPFPDAAFMMGITEVTQAQYSKVAGSNPSKFKGDSLPIESVSWIDAAKFCNSLSIMDGLKPVYNDKYERDSNANGWRLPTEAEWLFAARGGNSESTFEMSGSNNANEVAWIYSNSEGKPHPVATKKPNELGLFDMSGNVYEWCNDEVSISWFRVRGGSFFTGPADIRLGNSYDHQKQSYTSEWLGFRVVRSVTTK